jgi:cytochrome c553
MTIVSLIHPTRRGALAVALGVLASTAAAQAPAPFAHADANAGKALHDKDCIGCHAQRFNGDDTRIYTRPDRRVRTPQALRAQVATCNTQLNKQYFPEDEDNVAAYLNREFYRFKP